MLKRHSFPINVNVEPVCLFWTLFYFVTCGLDYYGFKELIESSGLRPTDLFVPEDWLLELLIFAYTGHFRIKLLMSSKQPCTCIGNALTLWINLKRLDILAILRLLRQFGYGSSIFSSLNPLGKGPYIIHQMYYQVCQVF